MTRLFARYHFSKRGAIAFREFLFIDTANEKLYRLQRSSELIQQPPVGKLDSGTVQFPWKGKDKHGRNTSAERRQKEDGEKSYQEEGREEKIASGNKQSTNLIETAKVSSLRCFLTRSRFLSQSENFSIL
ncbi:MAG TPA: hypothetical protein VLL54_09805 [Pyrinomonadaceae bacterium]|nr:hypothetical protein [Pyrinomonadaceae bacterium]